MNPEHLILAWLFLQPTRADEIFARLQQRHFASAFNGQAFSVAREIHGKGHTPDPYSVAQSMESSEAFDALMGMCDLPIGKNLDAVIDAVKKQGQKTKLKIALETAMLDLDKAPTAEDAYRSVKASIEAIGDDSAQDDGATLIGNLLPGYVQELQRRSSGGGELMGLSTGFRDLDKILCGLKPGNMIVIAGRPSMGKSTFAINIAQHNAIACCKSVVLFSMEMFAGDITDKIVSADTGVFLSKIQSGDVVENERDMAAVANSITRLKSAKLWIDTRGALSLDQVRSSCFRIQRKHGLDLVVVDYIGLMRGEGNGRYEQITGLSNGLQRLSRDLGIPVIVLSQLSRGVETRPDKRPVMSDLRESGAIEQDADVILFPYRDAYYDEDSRMRCGDADVAEIVVAKNKMGARASAYLIWQGSMSRFVDDNSGADWKSIGTESPKAKAKRGMPDA